MALIPLSWALYITHYKLLYRLRLLVLYKHISDWCVLNGNKGCGPISNTTGGLNLQRSSRQRAWLGHGSVSKTIGPWEFVSSPDSSGYWNAEESEAWGETPQQYCTLCVTASSLWAGVTAERRAEKGNCCLTTIMGSLKTFIQKSFLGTTVQHKVKYGFTNSRQTEISLIWHMTTVYIKPETFCCFTHSTHILALTQL